LRVPPRVARQATRPVDARPGGAAQEDEGDDRAPAPLRRRAGGRRRQTGPRRGRPLTPGRQRRTLTAAREIRSTKSETKPSDFVSDFVLRISRAADLIP